MLGVIPIIFALVLLDLLAEARPASPELLVSLAWLGGGLVGWILVQVLAAGLLRGRRVGLVVAWDAASASGALGVHAAWIWFAGLPDLIPGRLLALLPFVLLLLAGWYVTARSRLRPQEARSAVNNRLRFAAMPILAAVLLLDLLTGLLGLLGLDLAKLESESSAWAAAVSLGFIIIVLALLPILVSLIWRTRPMPPGPQRDLIEWGCRKMGIRFSRCHVWPAASGRFYNAAVLGLMPQTRFLLFSEDLLRALTPDQLKAVLGHELGHIRYRHIWFYLLFLMGGFGLAELSARGFIPILLPLLGDADLAYILSLILMLLVTLRIGFGFLSRACERQADLAGAELAGSTQHMQEALEAVARLSGQPTDAPSWMHGSIAERIAYLGRVEHDPGLRSWHHRGVMKLRFFVLLLLGMMLIFMMNQGQIRHVPASYLFDDPQRKEVVEQAIAGDSTPLYNFLLSMRPADRRSIGFAILDHLGEQQEEEGIGRVYEQRMLLWPFRRLSTEDRELDGDLENYLAYIIVAGTTAPLPEEVAIASDLCPGIEDRASALAERAPHIAASLLDTVACVRFVEGQRANAKIIFTRARDLLPAAEELPEDRRPRLVEFVDLLNRRIAACESSDSPLPLEDRPYQPEGLAGTSHSDPSPQDGADDGAGDPAPSP